MAATAPPRSPDPRGSNLDVDWLLHGKREFGSPQAKENTTKSRPNSQALPTSQEQTASPAAKQSPQEPAPAPRETQLPQSIPQRPQPAHTNSASATPAPPTSLSGHQLQASRATQDEPKKAGKSPKKDGRRASWFSSIGHKISGSSSTPRNASVDGTGKITPSPKLEFQNPFDKQTAQSSQQPSSQSQQQQQQKPEVITHHAPQGVRRPSVLVAAGTETKLDHPGFLTSALRRLSSGSAVTLGKGAGVTNTVAPRRVMNIDPNRERTKVTEFDQNKLRRVAFCVDVEIAGVASQADEESFGGLDPIGHPATSNASKPADGSPTNRASMSAKYKEKGEGKALKEPEKVEKEKEEVAELKPELSAETLRQHKATLDALEGAEQATEQTTGQAAEQAADEDVDVEADRDITVDKPMTRKKEKKKRSEAERKERRERKRRHAEMNGLVPLEITRDDDDSDSSSINTPAGASTPRNGDKPTTNPLRIYKRCCQLRETTAVSSIKEQITKPAATLAEAPGTVGCINLSGIKLSLPDIVTFGDWLAVVPVRKLILDDCELGDEAIRVILSGLLGCKTAEQARQNRKLPRRASGKKVREQLGVIEKLSLKNNSDITSLGWKHIALFIHLSRSLRAIDLTGIPYPKSGGDISRTPTESSVSSPQSPGSSRGSTEIGTLVARAIHERYGDRLEELILSGCALTASNVSELVDAAIKCRIRRFGLAGNNLSNDAMSHVVRYAVSDVCEGLDLGSNDLHDNEHLLSQVIHDQNPMFALSLADCNLTAEDLHRILPRLCEMKNFKFLDLSRNHGLFQGEVNAVKILRKYLPRMRALKRIHLVDVGLRPDHVIALTDVFPDCSSLAHINILDNAPLVQAMNSRKIEYQEEAAAFLASIMTATRVSHTLVAVELEVPSSDSSEVVKALSQQVVAYSLRNMERSALNDFGVESKSMPDKDAPDVLLHLVGHMDGYKSHDNDEPAPDEDYLIASTGVVKALGICLGNDDASRNVSRSITPTASGTATPRNGPLRPHQQRKKPKDVSRELCESARKIRTRLQPALVKEDRAGNREAYRRLFFLDQTLQGMIQRFEDEYPDTRSTAAEVQPDFEVSSPPETPNLSRMSSVVEGHHNGFQEGLAPLYEGSDDRLNPSASNTSLASKALTHEEGRMLKFGASMRRELLKPDGLGDEDYESSVRDTSEQSRLMALRHKLERLSGDEIRRKVEYEGADNVVKELRIDAQELQLMAREDPVGFEALRNCTLMKEVNRMSKQGPMHPDPNRRERISDTFNSQVTN